MKPDVMDICDGPGLHDNVGEAGPARKLVADQLYSSVSGDVSPRTSASASVVETSPD
jgi:hypothetical protein